MHRPRGFTLIDVLLVIVLLGIVAAALVTTSARLASQSSQTLKMRQAFTFAQGLLDEVRHMPFTVQDPNDAGTAFSAQPDLVGPEPGESRYGPSSRFDGVNDYNGFSMINAAGPLVGCEARVDVAPQGGLPGIAANEALRIVVTVICPGIGPVHAEGIRVRHAPNTL